MNEGSCRRLRLQLLTYDQSAEVLQLLRVGRHEFSHCESLRASVFASNKRSSFRRIDLGKLHDVVSGQHFNAIKVSGSGGRGRFRLNVEISPNNVLWADARAADGISGKDELIRMGYESIQMRVARLGIKNYPTTLDCSIVLERPDNWDYYETALKWVAASLEKANLELVCIGVADLLHGLTGETWSSLANSLDVPPGSDQNVGKFDRLHDIMICGLAVAEPLASRLEEAEQVVPLRVLGSLGMVAVPPNQGWRQDATKRVREWLIAPTTDNRREGAVTPGPLNYAIYSKREYEELDARGLVPRLSKGWIVQPVIDQKDAKALGIQAEDMIVLPMQRMLAARIGQETGQKLEQEHGTMESILKCYEQVYERYFDVEYMRRVFEHIRQLQRPDGIRIT